MTCELSAHTIQTINEHIWTNTARKRCDDFCERERVYYGMFDDFSWASNTLHTKWRIYTCARENGFFEFYNKARFL